MNVNRSAYDKWGSRINTKNRYEELRDALLEAILLVHKQHKAYGYHRIASIWRDRIGDKFSDNLIHRIYKYQQIKSKTKHDQWKRSGEQHDSYENKIQGNWNASRPFELVVSDMSQLQYRGRAVEWTFILDSFNHAILASSCRFKKGDPKPYYDCLAQWRKIIKKEDIQTSIYYHTDQGSVYASKAYNQGLEYYNIMRSMSRAGVPTDHASIESINGWVKQEI